MPRIIIPGNYQAQAIRYSPPDTDGLEYWGMFGDSSTFSGKNHAPGKPGALVVGAPTYSDNYMTIIPSAASIGTQVPQFPAMSFIAVAKVSVEASVASFISNGSGPSVANPSVSARGVSLAANAGTAGTGKVSLAMSMSVISAGVDTPFNATLNETLPLDTWACIAGVVQSNGQYKVYNLSAGTSAVAVASSPYNPVTSNFIIGAANTSPYSDPISMAMAAIYSTSKTDGEMTDIYNTMKAYFGRRGISI
jgi:hypothetical protein